MRKLALLLSVLILSGTVMAPAKPSTQKLTAEVVAVDPMGKKITIRDENGEDKTVTAEKKAARYIRNLKPGDKAVVTCTQNENGEIQAITNFKKIVKK